MQLVKLCIPFSIIFVFTLLLNLKSSLQDVNLPTHLIPEKYTLVIFSKLDSESPQFWGGIRITVECNEDTSKIILHKKFLEITKDKIEIHSEDSRSTFIVTTDSYNPDSEQYTMNLNAELKNGNKYDIFIPFEGKFSSDSTGYFLITRIYHNGQHERKKFFAGTHLGYADARSVFPCFDQVDMPAEFQIFLAHPKKFKSFSNMHIVGVENVPTPGTWEMDEFAKTTKMPPSAVAIALIPADFVRKRLRRNSNLPLRIWGEKLDIKNPDFPSRMVIKAFRHYTEYFTVPFAFQKLNVILYAKFEPQKADNGIIVTGKSCKIDLTYLSVRYGPYENATYICHLMSHQWIGTYAPMSRKNDNWLIEALALHLDVQCAQKVSTGSQNDFSDINIVDTYLFALKNDQEGLIGALLGAENDSQETSETVDPSNLRKAQCLIRMLNFFLGEKVFQLGINNHFRKFGLKSSSVDQVWATFSETAAQSNVELEGLTVQTIMNSWVTRKEFPLIHVTVEREKNRVLLEQKRFKLLDELNEKKPRPVREPECWHIPLSYMRKGESESETVRLRKWITCDGPATIDINLDLDEWILVNLDLNGIYFHKNPFFAITQIHPIEKVSIKTMRVPSRTSYDLENWSLIQKTLNSNEYERINSMTRVRLISDAFEFSKVGLLQYKMLFDIVNYLIYEKDFSPWSIASKELENIHTHLFDSPLLLRLYEARIRKMLDPAFKNIDSSKFPSNEPVKNELKTIIIRLSCDFGLDSCKEMCKIFFSDWFESIAPDRNNSIPPIIRDIIYCQAIKDGKEKEWNFLWNLYPTKFSDAENDAILYSLGCSNNGQLLKKYLELSLDQKKVLPSDSIKIFRSLSKNKIGYELMKTFLAKNLEAIHKLNNDVNLPIDSYFITLFDKTMKREDYYKLLQLAIDHKQLFQDFDKIYNYNVNIGLRNVLWLEKHEFTLLDALKNEV